MSEASDARMTVGGFKMSPAEAQQEHARLQSNRLRMSPISGDHVYQDRPRWLLGSILGSDLKFIVTTGEAVGAGLGRGRTTIPQSMSTKIEQRPARDRERCDTSTGSDEEESLRKPDGERKERGREEETATRGRNCGLFKNLSVSGGSFITPLYWYHYTTNQPTNQQVVVSAVIPQLSSQGVAA